VIIPIGHDRLVRGLPWATIGIIAICTGVQIYSTAVMPSDHQLHQLLDPHAVTPYRDGGVDAALEQNLRSLFDRILVFRYGYQSGSGVTFELFTSMFVHDGWLHLIGNMLFLFVAGSALEDRWGRGGFVAFYLAAGVVATLCFDALYSGEPTQLVGASGAIAAVMGAFLVYFSRTQITLFYWVLRYRGTTQAPAYTVLPLWLVLQVLWASLDDNGVTGVAYTAHIGGFVFGAGLALALRRIRRPEAEDLEAAARALPPVAVAVQLPSRPMTFEERYRRCVAAIRGGDAAAVRGLSSRLMLELSRLADHPRCLELYRAIADRFGALALTDGAFAAAAAAADVIGDSQAYIAVATAMLREQPTSPMTPKVVWRLAEHYRDSGRVDLAAATLEAVVERFPHDPFGVRARDALAGRRA
jgi:membrane associated rhomboid family serine protease